MDFSQFAGTLREQLETHGFSQKQLARAAATTEATISRYVTGKNQPEISIVVRIAKALNVSVDYLCGLTDTPAPKESLGAEMILLMRCYGKADAQDKETLWSLLRRYMTQEENEQPINPKGEGTKRAKAR